MKRLEARELRAPQLVAEDLVQAPVIDAGRARDAAGAGPAWFVARVH